MAKRRLPNRPDLDHVRREAKALFADYRRGDGAAVADFEVYHPKQVPPDGAALSDAQLVLARAYRFTSWPRLKVAVELLVAIDDENLAALERVVRAHPGVLSEGTRGEDTVATWGVPFAYATTFGRPEAAAKIAELAGKDMEAARRDAVELGLEQLGAWFLDETGVPKPGAVMHPCELLNPEGLAYLLERGAALADAEGDRLAPVAQVLRTYSRNPDGKRRCLAVCAAHGVDLPDTPVMALHRGRIDLLEKHVVRDPGLLGRTFTHAEIFPEAAGFGAGERVGQSGTPLDGSTLLHLCGEYGEVEIARWLLERGADVDAAAGLDAEGFGGHTPLFNAVVTCTAFGHEDDAFARLLLDAGAEPGRRASLRKRLQSSKDEAMHEYREVTAAEWGERFHTQSLVNKAALRLVKERAG